MDTEMPNHVLVLFGATGDLAQKKLLPAICRNLTADVTHMPVVCVGRSQLSTEEYLEQMGVYEYAFMDDEGARDQVLQYLYYVPVDIQNDDPEAFGQQLQELNDQFDCDNRFAFYFAIPNFLFYPAASFIDQSGIRKTADEVKVAFEKPFGQDVASATELQEQVTQIFPEDQIYRVDHYLGKGLIENMIVFRCVNTLFANVWHRSCIDHVQITLAEDFGIAGRADYYDSAGHIQDVVQSHVLQTLSLAAMECPESLDAQAIRDAKVKVLQQIQPPSHEDVVIGQYGSGSVNGSEVCGYFEEPGVPEESKTETFVACKTYIDTERWYDVPWYIRTGKRLDGTYAEINVVLQESGQGIFTRQAGSGHEVIRIRLKPDEGIYVTFHTKAPRSHTDIELTTMDFCYSCHFGSDTPEAYEMIFQELLRGDHTIFVRWDEIKASWVFTDALLAAAQHQKTEFPNYAAGSTGPAAAEELMRRDGREWLKVEAGGDAT